jgi:hypothetical protein
LKLKPSELVLLLDSIFWGPNTPISPMYNLTGHSWAGIFVVLLA